MEIIPNSWESALMDLTVASKAADVEITLLNNIVLYIFLWFDSMFVYNSKMR